MQYTRTGLVLCTENYEKCVRFYRDVLELPLLHALDNARARVDNIVKAL